MNLLLRTLSVMAAFSATALQTQAAPANGTTVFNSPTSAGFANQLGQPSPVVQDYLGYKFTVSTAFRGSITHASSRVNLGNGNTTPASTFNYLAFGSDDGSEFKFSGCNFRCTNGTWLGPITLTGYRNGVAVSGATANHTFSATATDNTLDVSADTDFNYVDEIRITGHGGTGIGFISFNSITAAAGIAPAPTVTSITPNSGSSAGGTNVAITGTNFFGTPTVTIGGAPATNVNRAGDTTITCITPAGTAGARSVLVTATGGTNAANTLFTYTAPAAPPVVTGVTSSTANGAYRATQSVSIQVAFDASVTVTGTPTLALNSGGSASYASGSPGTTLTFNYTVGAGQTAADLDYSATNSLALSGGTINATTGGAAATLTLPSPGAAGSLGANKAIVIDTTAPTIGIGSPSVSSIVAGAGSVTYTVT
jgi:hypothetical protein